MSIRGCEGSKYNSLALSAVSQGHLDPAVYRRFKEMASYKRVSVAEYISIIIKKHVEEGIV